MIYKRVLKSGRGIEDERGICRCINQGCQGCPMERIVTESTKTEKKMWSCAPKGYETDIREELHCIFEYFTDHEDEYYWRDERTLSAYLAAYNDAHQPANESLYTPRR